MYALKYLLQLTVLALALSHAAAGFNLTVGVLFTESGTDATVDGTRAWRAKETYNVTRIFRETVLSRKNSTGLTHLDDVTFRYFDVGSGSGTAGGELVSAKSAQVCNGTYGDMDAILAPFSSGLTERAAIACDGQNQLLIAGGAASESVYSCLSSNIGSDGCTGKVVGQRRFDELFGVINLSSDYMEPVVQLTKLAGASSIAFFHQTGLFATTMCEQAHTFASFFGFDTVYDVYSLDQTSDASYETLFSQLEANKPDVVIGCTLNTACTQFMEMAYTRNYLPKFLALSVCVGTSSVEESLGSKFNYIAGPVQWDKRCADSACTESSSASLVHFYNQESQITAPNEFNDAYLNFSGVEPSYQAAGSMATLYSLAYAVQRAASNATDKMRTALEDVSQPSYYGLIEGSRLGANREKQMIILQYDSTQAAQIVYPLSSDTSGVIYPIPSWDERTYVRRLYALPAEQFMIGLVTATSIMIVSLIITMIVHRNHSAVKATSVLFVSLSLTGLLITNLSLIAWPAENDEYTCMTRPWLASIGMTLFLSPIAAKMYRIKTIFDHINAPIRISELKVDDKTLLKYVGLMTVPTVIVLMIMQIFDPLSSTIVVTDPIRPSLNYTDCQSKSVVYGWILVTYFFALMVALAVLSFQTRLSWDKFKESQQMAFALYGFLLASVVLLALQISGQNSRTYQLTVRAILSTLAMWTWCFALYGPKLLKLCTNPQGEQGDIMISNIDIGGVKGAVKLDTMKAPSRIRETKETEQETTQYEMEIATLEKKLAESESLRAQAEKRVKKMEDRVAKLVDEKIEAMEAQDE